MLHVAAQALAAAWTERETEMGRESLEGLVEAALAAGVLTEITQAAMATGEVEDPRGLFSTLQDIAGRWRWRTPEGTLDAGVWFLPLFAPTDEAAKWWTAEGWAGRVERIVEGWFMAQGQRPWFVDAAERWIHPTSLAGIPPSDLRRLAMGLFAEGGHCGEAAQLCGALAEQVCDTLPEPGSTARWITQRLLPVAVALPAPWSPSDRAAGADLWRKLTLPLGLPVNAALGEPVMLRTALVETLYQHISLHWRTQRTQEAAALFQPLPPLAQPLGSFLRQVRIGASGAGMVRVSARGPNGPLAPVDVPADWALCKGDRFLHRLITQIIDEGQAEGETGEVATDTPVGKRIVH